MNVCMACARSFLEGLSCGVQVDSEGNVQEQLHLGIDRHTADLEGSLLDAAAANATIQLGESCFSAAQKHPACRVRLWWPKDKLAVMPSLSTAS